MSASAVEAWLTGACLALFAFSGMMKWLPALPVDPTVLFGALLSLPFALAVIRGAPRLRGLVGITVLVTLVFFVWYAFTAIYSASSQFWMHKELTLVLDAIAFMVPLVCFSRPEHFRSFNVSVMALALVATATVLGLYAAGLIQLLIGARNNPLTSKVPDYLAIGSLLGCGVLLAMSRPRLWNLGIAMAGIAAMLVLAARGPILFTALLIPLGMFLYRGRDGAPRVDIWRYVLVLVVAGVGFTQWKGAEASLTRFTKIFESGRDFDQTLRVEEFAIAGDVIAETPFLGVGLGGYGDAGYGLDEDFYPHNLFLESYAEAGVPGLLLFTISIILTAIAVFHTRRHGAMAYFVVFLFLVFNYSKSGGFVGARDLYMFMGVLLAYVNAAYVDDESYETLGLARSA